MTVTIEDIDLGAQPSQLTLRLLASLLGIGQRFAYPDRLIKAIRNDSRQVRENDLFVAVQGDSFDGHDFAGEAAARGAAAVVTQRRLPLPAHVVQLIVPDSRKALAELANYWAGEPSRKLISVAITGTNGKTTVSYLLQSVLNEAGIPSGRLGTVAYDLGDKEIPASTTTPGPISVHSYLAQMCAGGCQAVVMETSSHALVQRRTDCIDFDAAVFTNLSRDHLDYHGTMDEYRHAKGLLFEGLKPDAFAILNADEATSTYYARICQARVVTYGLSKNADVRAREISTTLQGTQFSITGLGTPILINSRMVGIHNVYNYLAAAACASQLGPSPATIKAALDSSTGPPGRLEKVNMGQHFTVLVDYAHTDDALDKVLSALRPLCKGRLLVVFGCGGNRDRGKRPRMAAVVQRWADYIWLTNDNPRSEDPEAIIKDIRQGITDAHKFTTLIDRGEAIASAIATARADDLVLIAGKGHEVNQIYKDKVVHFDDRQVARQCLSRRTALSATV